MGEFDLIRTHFWRAAPARPDGSGVRLGNGDDCALLVPAGLAQIKCDECTHSMRHDNILGDDKRRMECGHKRSMERSQ